MDSLKEDHLGSLIVLAISLVGMAFYAFFEAMHRLYDFEPWSIASVLLGFGGFVCLVRMISLVYRRSRIYRLGRDIESRRSLDSFSLDQSTSTSLIDLTCRLQTCRKRSNIHLIATSALAVSLIGGTVFAYQQGVIALARAELQAVQLAEQADLQELEHFRDHLKTEVQKEVFANLSNSKNSTQTFRRCTIMEHDKMYNCITNGEYRSMIEKYNHFLEKINTIVKYKLVNKPYIDNKLDFRIEYMKGIDQIFYDLYSSKDIQEAILKSDYMQSWNSYQFENTKLDEVMSKMVYLDALVSSMKMYIQADISRTSLDFDVSFYEEFLSEYNYPVLPM